jgi:EmrB/QacA subfamily drug resistance transporter
MTTDTSTEWGGGSDSDWTGDGKGGGGGGGGGWGGQEEGPPLATRWWALGVVLLGAFMILLDSTIVNVAIPPIQVDLSASYGSVEWVVSGYALAYGLLLIPAGRLGDRFGYRPLFLIGILGFTASSVLCGTADSPTQLVVWRVIQGAMAGVINPQILAVIQVAFPAKERARAYSIYGAVSGLAVALGPLLGGLLINANIHDWDWRPIFLINLPLGVLAAAAAVRLLPAAKGRPGPLDVVGILLVSATVLLVTVPLVEGREKGWPVWAWVLLALAAPMVLAFWAWESWRLRRDKGPLVDVRLFRNRGFSAGVGIGLAYFAGFIGLFFALSLYLQLGLGRTPLAAGLILLPFAAGAFLTAAFSDKVTERIGRGVLWLGSGLVIAGAVGVIVTVSQVGADLSGPELLPSLLVCGLGSGLVIAPNVDLVLAYVPWQEAGAASGVLNTMQRLGNALGVALVGVALFGALGTHADASAQAVLPQLRTELAAAGMPASQIESSVSDFTRCYVARSNALDPTVTPPGCPQAQQGPIGDAFTAAVDRAQRDNFTDGIQRGAIWALGALVVTFLLVFVLPKERPKPAWG